MTEQLGDREAFFAESVHRWAVQVGIAPGRIGPGARKPRQLREPVGIGETTAAAQVVENSISHTAKEVGS